MDQLSQTPSHFCNFRSKSPRVHHMRGMSFEFKILRTDFSSAFAEGETEASSPQCSHFLFLFSFSRFSFPDSRRGRNWEVASSDPYLTGEIGAAYAHGFQGERPQRRIVQKARCHGFNHQSLSCDVAESLTEPEYLLGVLTIKHWVAYNVEANRGGFNAVVSKFDLTDSYLRAWRPAVVDGRAAGVMCSCEFFGSLEIALFCCFLGSGRFSW